MVLEPARCCSLRPASHRRGSAQHVRVRQPGGRSSYFIPDPYKFWIESTRSGLALVPKDALLGGLPALTTPFVLALGLGVWLVLGRLGRVARPSVPEGGMLLVALFVASFGLFFAAHALLFTLYLPARHVQFSLPIVWALAGGFFWTLLGGRSQESGVRSQKERRETAPPLPRSRAVGRRRAEGPHGTEGRESSGLPGRVEGGRGEGAARRWTNWPGWFVLAGVVLLVLHPPPTGVFYVVGRTPTIYEYLRATPPDTRVAALPADSSIIPLFGQRPVLTSFEHALPYHLGYYLSFRDRTRALNAAYYAPTLAPWVKLIQDEHVGIVLANATQLERRARDNRDRPPSLAKLLESCGVLRERDLVVLPADCIVAAANGQTP